MGYKRWTCYKLINSNVQDAYANVRLFLNCNLLNFPQHVLDWKLYLKISKCSVASIRPIDADKKNILS